jgi:hypothetical protein
MIEFISIKSWKRNKKVASKLQLHVLTRGHRAMEQVTRVAPRPHLVQE